MIDVPEISVVMGVHNSAPSLAETLKSVLLQEGVDHEFIVVDDGSTDATPRILDAAASTDKRMVVIHQENQGLTRALIAGCKIARGEFISRQDAGGDVSRPGKLSRLAAILRANQHATLASCGTRYLGPKGEHLYDVIPEAEDLTDQLTCLDPRSLCGPSSHPATMFRRSDYMSVGGYRSAFAVAQDLDLWVRLVERGSHLALPAVLYVTRVTADSITSRKRTGQVKAKKMIVEGALRRRRGQTEDDLLERVSRFTRKRAMAPRRLMRSRSFFFIGSCLQARTPAVAREYYRRSLAQFPFHIKSLWRLLFKN